MAAVVAGDRCRRARREPFDVAREQRHAGRRRLFDRRPLVVAADRDVHHAGHRLRSRSLFREDDLDARAVGTRRLCATRRCIGGGARQWRAPARDSDPENEGIMLDPTAWSRGLTSAAPRSSSPSPCRWRWCCPLRSSASSGAGSARRFPVSSCASSAARSPCSPSWRSSPRSGASGPTGRCVTERSWPALAFAGWYSLAEATGNPDVDVVQRFHFIEYGVITFLFYRAWRAARGSGDPRLADSRRTDRRYRGRVVAVVHPEPRR